MRYVLAVLFILTAFWCPARTWADDPTLPMVTANPDGTYPGQGEDLPAIQARINGDNEKAWAKYNATVRRVRRQNALYGDAAIGLKTVDGVRTASILARGGVELNPVVGVPFMPILLRNASGRENTVDILAGAAIVFGGPIGALVGHIARGINYSHYIHRVHRLQTAH